MINPIIPTSKNKTAGHLAGWLDSRVRKAADRLFSRSDRVARDHGWQIISLNGGLARRYRDPRFDALCDCPQCEGGGYLGGEACGSCQGTGRIASELPTPGEVTPGDENALAATA